MNRSRDEPVEGRGVVWLRIGNGGIVSTFSVGGFCIQNVLSGVLAGVMDDEDCGGGIFINGI